MQFIMGEMIRNPEWIRKRMVQNMSFLIVFRTFSEQVEKRIWKKERSAHLGAISFAEYHVIVCFSGYSKANSPDNSDAAKTSVFDLVIENRKTEVADFIIKTIKT